MRKITLSILLLIAAISFSSCVIIAEDHTKYYDFTFVNNTNSEIADWYLKSESGIKVARSQNYENINRNSSSKLSNVREDHYKVMYSYAASPNLYYESNYFNLNSDTKYYFRENSFYIDR